MSLTSSPSLLKGARALGALVALCGLAACANLDTRDNPGPCPRAFALYDAARVVDFKGEEAFENVGFTAEIQDVRTLCRYAGDRPINAFVEIDMGFGRGPAADGRVGQYEYWVAVTRRDNTVIERQTFPITVRFDRDEQRVFQRETVERIVIPRADEGVSGGNFEILVGFTVTEPQLEFNRAGKRFVVDAGQ